MKHNLKPFIKGSHWFLCPFSWLESTCISTPRFTVWHDRGSWQQYANLQIKQYRVFFYGVTMQEYLTFWMCWCQRDCVIFIKRTLHPELFTLKDNSHLIRAEAMLRSKEGWLGESEAPLLSTIVWRVWGEEPGGASVSWEGGAEEGRARRSFKGLFSFRVEVNGDQGRMRDDGSLSGTPRLSLSGRRCLWPRRGQTCGNLEKRTIC